MHPTIADLPGLLTAGGMLLNFIWSAVNLKMQASMEKRIGEHFVTRIECGAEHRVCDERHQDVCRRLDKLEGAKV